MKAFLKYSLMILTMFIFGSCDQQQAELIEKGFLAGKITIGPLCPVESIPPLPECQPNEQTYKNWPIVVYSPDKETEIAKILPNSDGIFMVDLEEGKYIIDLDRPHTFGKNLPSSITIESGKTLTFNIDIDTGIR